MFCFQGWLSYHVDEAAALISPTWMWIGLEDDSLFDEFRSKGAKVLQEPKNRSWANEMKIADIAGNVMWLGTEPRADKAFT